MKVASLFPKVAAAAVALSALSAIVGPSPAQAWWRGGVWVGVAPPLYYAPPYYPPPVYYAPPPPPVVYTPPGFYGSQQPQYGQSCYAGPYTCPLQPPAPAGSGCSCPANQGRAYGRAG
jgi:hypothetical protein